MTDSYAKDRRDDMSIYAKDRRDDMSIYGLGPNTDIVSGGFKGWRL